VLFRSADDASLRGERESLKSLVARLLEAPAAAEVSPAVYADLQRRGLVEGSRDGTVVFREDPREEARRRLSGSAEEFLSGDAGGMPTLAAALFARGDEECVAKLQERCGLLLRDGEPPHRHRAAVALRGLLPVYWENHHDADADPGVDALMNAAVMERTFAVAKEVLGALGEAARHAYLTKSVERACEITALIRRLRVEGDEVMEGCSSEAGDVLHRVVQELLDLLVEDLSSGDEERAAAAGKILEHAGDRAVAVFVDIVRGSPEPRLRHLAAERLSRFGMASVRALAAELNLGNSSGELLNILSVLEAFRSEEILTGLEGLRFYPDSDFRRLLVRLLSKIPGERSAKILTQFLQDTDPGVRRIAAEALGSRRYKPAGESLLSLLVEKEVELCEEVCIALGRLREERAVQPLADLLRRHGGLLHRGAAVPETVRVRAAWALQQIGSIDARRALKEFADDEDLQVRAIARDGA
jgi:HEAT repeat protein